MGHPPLGRRVLTAALSMLLVLTACSASDEPTPATSTTATTGTPDSSPTATLADDVVSPGRVLDPAEARSTSFAWQHPAGVLLTTTSGGPVGHLPGFLIDRPASDRLAAPVVTDSAGDRFVLTSNGAVPFGEPIPLTGASLSISDSVATVSKDNAILAELVLTSPDDVWVSSTGTVVGVFGGDAYDIENDTAIEVEDDCRIADRHTAEVVLQICDHGSTLLSDGATFEAPTGASWGFAVTGLTGREILAVANYDDGRREVHLGSSDNAETTAIDAEGVLSYRSSGNAWIASFGASGSLLEVSPDGAVNMIRELPGVTDVVPLFR